MKYRKPNKTIYYHLITWLIFILYESIVVFIVRQGSNRENLILKGYIIPYILNISLFYVHALFVLRYCFSGARNVVLILPLLICELGAYLVLMGFLQDKAHSSHSVFFSLYEDKIGFIRHLWRGIYFLIFSTAYWFIERNFDRLKRMKELERKALVHEKEKQKLELDLVASQNAFLQAQINPHLLFNTLNFIHSEVQDVSEKASEAIIILSDMMRYNLIENKQDGKVELEKEVEQIQNLININQFRFHNKLQLRLNANGDLGGVRIVPLILVPFVENLFKYADLTDKENPVIIKIWLDSGELHFMTTNKKRKTISFSSPGIGIKNVQTRLQSYYPDKHSLEVIGEECFFSVYLRLFL